MIHEETVEVFEQEYAKNKIADSPLKGDGYYVYWHPDMPSYWKVDLRNNFRLLSQEELLIVITSNSHKGLIITDNGIYYRENKRHPEKTIYISWDEIRLVKFTDDKLYFNAGRRGVVLIPFPFYDRARINGCSRLFARMLANIAKSQGSAEFICDIQDAFNALQKEGKEEEALQYAIEYRAQDRSNVELSCDIAEIYWKRGQTEKALSVLEEDVGYIDANKEVIPDYSVMRLALEGVVNMFNNMAGNRSTLFKDFHKIILQHPFPYFPLFGDKASFYCNKLDRTYTELFLDIPYSRRKLLVPVRKYGEGVWEQETIQIIGIEQVSGLEFPIGHPTPNQLYIGHPYIPNKYVLFDGYELEFIAERIREYCYIMQSMGAEEINIESVNSVENKSAIDDSRTSEVEGNYGANSGSIKTSSTAANQFFDSIKQRVQIHQIYHPSHTPVLPSDLVWYNHEPSWQLTCKQRMQGTLLEHEERIETGKSRVVNNSELMTLSADFKVLTTSVGGKWEQSINKQFELHEDAVLSIKVKFASLESLKGEAESASAQMVESQKVEFPCKEEFTTAEEKFFEEIKAILEESSEISSGERRLLNRLREELGLSEERAIEIENMCKPIK